jgi:hypothetical protein
MGDDLLEGLVIIRDRCLIHISTVAELIKSKKLTKNEKFLIEGNEENCKR